jgi:putative oxidoreductase
MAEVRYFVSPLGPVYQRLDQLAWLLLRAMYGGFFIPHGAQKLFAMFGGGGPIKTAEGFARNGLEPSLFWAYYLGSLEFFGGMLILIGLFTRPVAALFFGFMFVAATWANVDRGYFWTKGGIEMPILLAVLALVILIRGGGAVSVDRLIGREF